MEALEIQSASATWAANALGLDNVSFLNTDAITDREQVQPHDIVFMSEVLNHFPCPFTGMIRAVNLARELLIST